MGLSIGQYLNTSEVRWLILAPLIMFIIYFHNLMATLQYLKRNSTSSAKGSKIDTKVKKASKKNKSLFQKIDSFFESKGLLDPYHSEDTMYIVFFFGPIISFFTGYLFEIISVAIMLMYAKEVLWFVFYRSLLKTADKNNN